MTAAGHVEVVSKNANGDGSVYFEPARMANDGKIRAGYWRASYRNADGERRTVSGLTRVQAEARCEVKLAEIAAMPAVGSRFSRATTVAELTDWWLDSVARHQLGATSMVEPSDNPGGVRSAYVRDPDGNLFSIYRFGQPATPTG